MFRGAGGFRLGLWEAGNFKCLWANDNDKYACQIYQQRFGTKELVEGDIRDIRTDTIPEHDLLTAGFPCQSFSVAGKRRGFQDKTRGTLFYE
ncbi:DNA (cytosine-5-)-methyltransferase, partial [bacterium]|nr:DNA (cytosine-5-)-methyltransferase [bacterium]